MAGGVEVARAYVTIIPSAKGAQAAVEKQVVPASAKAGTKAGKTLGSGMVSTLRKYAKPIAAALSVAAVTKFAKTCTTAFTNVASSTKTLQRAIGGTNEQVSSIAAAMKLSGADATKATTGLTKFAKSLGAVAGDSEKAAELSKSLGVSVTDAGGKVKNVSEILPEMADHYNSLGTEAEKTSYLMTNFGRSGQALAPYMAKGSAGMDELKKKAEELGLVIGDDAMTKFGEYKSAIREWQAAIEGAEIRIGAALTPLITDATTALSTVLVPMVQTASGAIADFIDGFSSVDITGFGDAIAGLGTSFATAFSGT